MRISAIIPNLNPLSGILKKNGGNPGLGNVEFSCNEESQIEGYRQLAGGYTGSGNNFFLEYNGTFYLTGMVWIH
jgi:hypothetical protein